MILQVIMGPLIIDIASQYFLEMLCLIRKNQLIMAYVTVLPSSGQLDFCNDEAGTVL